MAEDKTEAVHLDAVLAELGSFGKYQLLTLAMLVLPFVMEAIYSTHFIFYAYDVDYRCRIDECDWSSTSTIPSFNESWTTIAVPQNRTGQCYRYGANITGEYNCTKENFDTSTLVECKQWIYEDPDSFVAEFDLGCQSWKRTLVGTIRSVGNMIALLFSGMLSDRLGRKVVIYSAGSLVGIIGTGKTFITNYICYMSLELIEAIVGAGLYSAVFIYSIEMVSKDRRLLYNCTLGIIYSVGGAFYSVIAWKIPYWRYQLRAVYAPALLIFFYVFILDEGVRWLLSRGRKEKAIEIILKMSQINSVPISNKTLANIKYEEKNTEDKTPLMKTLRSGIMISRLLICCVWWITCTFVYYGLMIFSVSLGGDKYVDFALSYLVEIPATIAVAFLPDKVGRKISLLVSFLLGGVICVSLAFVPSSMQWLTTVTFLLGKLISSFTFGVVYVYTSELFPTYTRNSMHSLCSCVGRVGAMLAPQTPLLAKYMTSLPTILFGVCSLVAGFLTFLTPDTKQVRLPDNVHQAEHINELKDSQRNITTKI